jgi:hypothetical protein
MKPRGPTFKCNNPLEVPPLFLLPTLGLAHTAVVVVKVKLWTRLGKELLPSSCLSHWITYCILIRRFKAAPPFWIELIPHVSLLDVMHQI